MTREARTQDRAEDTMINRQNAKDANERQRIITEITEARKHGEIRSERVERGGHLFNQLFNQGIMMNTNYFTPVVLIFFCTGLLGCANVQSDMTQRDARKARHALAVLRSAETVDSSGVGYSGDRTPTYDAFVILCDNSSNEQLIELLDDTNAVVTTYAFWALSERLENSELFPLLMKQMTKEESVQMFSGCRMYTSLVGDEALKIVELTSSEQAQVLDYLLVTDNNLSAKGRMLQEADIPPTYYQRVRTLAQTTEPKALVALAKFKREEDVEIILAELKDHPFYALRAISYYPHERFLPHLLEYQNILLEEKYWTTTQREFYTAVAKYRTPMALTILEKPFDLTLPVPMREHHIRFVSEAIAKENDSFHNSLRKKLP